MSSGGESGSGHGSDFDPEFDGDESPVRGANYPQTANSIGSRRSKEKKAASAKVPTTPTTQSSQPKAKSPTPNSNQPVGSTSQQSSQLQGPFILPGVGGGIPIMLPGQANMTSNERAHLYTFLRQLPLGFARVRIILRFATPLIAYSVGRKRRRWHRTIAFSIPDVSTIPNPLL